jgi:hypothetical protein
VVVTSSEGGDLVAQREIRIEDQFDGIFRTLEFLLFLAKRSRVQTGSDRVVYYSEVPIRMPIFDIGRIIAKFGSVEDEVPRNGIRSAQSISRLEQCIELQAVRLLAKHLRHHEDGGLLGIPLNDNLRSSIPTGFAFSGADSW